MSSDMINEMMSLKHETSIQIKYYINKKYLK